MKLTSEKEVVVWAGMDGREVVNIEKGKENVCVLVTEGSTKS